MTEDSDCTLENPEEELRELNELISAEKGEVSVDEPAGASENILNWLRIKASQFVDKIKKSQWFS